MESNTFDEYEAMAPIYDAATAWALDPLRWHLARTASPRGGKALDVCCGTGRQCRFFTVAGLGAVGLDISRSMLHKASRQPGRLRLVQGDATRLPFGDGSFSFTTVALALHEKPPETRPAIVAEMIRVTKPGGRLALVDYLVPASLAGRGLSPVIGVVERLAGRKHYEHYTHFMRLGGLEGLLSRLGLASSPLSRRFGGLIGVAVVDRPAAWKPEER